MKFDLFIIIRLIPIYLTLAKYTGITEITSARKLFFAIQPLMFDE